MHLSVATCEQKENKIRKYNLMRERVYEWKEVDVSEIDLPTNFFDQFRCFLDWKMDRIQLINYPAHLFSLNMTEITYLSMNITVESRKVNTTE